MPNKIFWTNASKGTQKQCNKVKIDFIDYGGESELERLETSHTTTTCLYKSIEIRETAKALLRQRPQLRQ